MNIFYAKVALYAYSNLTELLSQIDDLVLKKALGSMSNFSPCVEQCEKILNLTNQKDIIINLKLAIDKALDKLTPSELDLLDYKYFRLKPKEYFATFDASSRNYFRNQIRVAKKFADLLEKTGYGDKRFEEEIFLVDFFVALRKKVEEKEKMNYKNKSKKLKSANKEVYAKFCASKEN